MSGIAVVIAPTEEPITVDDVRAFVLQFIDDGNVQDVIERLITAARQAAEQELGRYLITQTLDLYLDQFPQANWRIGPADRRDHCEHEILLPPIQSVTAITYIDSDGNTQTLDPSAYLVDAASKPARITPAYGTYWPYARRQANAVKVRFVAGYGAAAAVPECIKHWMSLWVKTTYDNRDGLILGENRLVTTPSTYVNGLLDPERVLGWR